MALSSIVFGGINLNNGTTHFVETEGFNLGNKQTLWDEVTNYAGTANLQVNVRQNSLVEVTIPMQVQGSSLSNLETLLTSLWAQVEGGTDSSPKSLVVDGTTYYVVVSSRPREIFRDSMYQNRFRARFILTLWRKP